VLALINDGRSTTIEYPDRDYIPTARATTTKEVVITVEWGFADDEYGSGFALLRANYGIEVSQPSAIIPGGLLCRAKLKHHRHEVGGIFDAHTTVANSQYKSLRSRRLCVLCVFVGLIRHTEQTRELSVFNGPRKTQRTQRPTRCFESEVFFGSCWFV
jgi:hypothetical protein